MWNKIHEFLIGILTACAIIAAFGAAAWFLGGRLYDAFFVDHPPKRDRLRYCDDLMRDRLQDYPECFFLEEEEEEEDEPGWQGRR